MFDAGPNGSYDRMRWRQLQRDRARIWARETGQQTQQRRSTPVPVGCAVSFLVLGMSGILSVLGLLNFAFGNVSTATSMWGAVVVVNAAIIAYRVWMRRR